MRRSRLTWYPTAWNMRRICRFIPCRRITRRRVGDRERSRAIFARWPSRTIPRRSFGASDGSHGRSSVISYSLSTLKRGWVSRCANSPSLVRSSKPSVCASRRPTLKSCENFWGKRSKTVSRAWRSFRVETNPAGFIQHDRKRWSDVNKLIIDFDVVARCWLRTEVCADLAIDCDAARSDQLIAMPTGSNDQQQRGSGSSAWRVSS